MSYEIPPIRFYYRREGQVVVLRSADPAFVVNVMAGWEAFEDLRRRNPRATFESESARHHDGRRPARPRREFHRLPPPRGSRRLQRAD